MPREMNKAVHTLKVVVQMIERQQEPIWGPEVSTNSLMFAYGATDELNQIFRDIEEELGIKFPDDIDPCEIGELTVKQFVDYVYNIYNAS